MILCNSSYYYLQSISCCLFIGYICTLIKNSVDENFFSNKQNYIITCTKMNTDARYLLLHG